MRNLKKVLYNKALSNESKVLFSYLFFVDENRNLDSIKIIASDLNFTKSELLLHMNPLIMKGYISINNKSIEINRE